MSVPVSEPCLSTCQSSPSSLCLPSLPLPPLLAPSLWEGDREELWPQDLLLDDGPWADTRLSLHDASDLSSLPLLPPAKKRDCKRGRKRKRKEAGQPPFPLPSLPRSSLCVLPPSFSLSGCSLCRQSSLCFWFPSSEKGPLCRGCIHSSPETLQLPRTDRLENTSKERPDKLEGINGLLRQRQTTLSCCFQNMTVCLAGITPAHNVPFESKLLAIRFLEETLDSLLRVEALLKKETFGQKMEELSETEQTYFCNLLGCRVDNGESSHGSLGTQKPPSKFSQSSQRMRTFSRQNSLEDPSLVGLGKRLYAGEDDTFGLEELVPGTIYQPIKQLFHEEVSSF